MSGAARREFQVLMELCVDVGVWMWGRSSEGRAWTWGGGDGAARPGESETGQARAGGCSDFQEDDYFMESSQVQSYVCLLSAVTLSLFNVVLTAARFYKSK